MSEFEICYTEHELKYVRVDARNKKEAERKFHLGEIEWDAAKRECNEESLRTQQQQGVIEG